jgi:hypothetical protein
MLRNPKEAHEANVAQGQYPHGDPPEGHQSYYKVELPSQAHEPAIMTGELHPKVQLAADVRNSHVELPTEGRTHVAPVELGTGVDQR